MAKMSMEAAQTVLARIHIGNVYKKETYENREWHYCGRESQGFSESSLRNMHNAKGQCRHCFDGRVHGGGGNTLPYFDRDFYWKVLTLQPDVIKEMRSIWRVAAVEKKDIVLLCWCWPQPCHTVIIRDRLLELATGVISREPATGLLKSGLVAA